MNFDVVAVAMESPSLGRTAYDNTMEALLTLESDGQLDRLKLDGTVLIKPNFTQPPNPSLKYGPRDSDMSIHNHVCTDPFAIKAACDFILNSGGKVIIAEGTKWPGGTKGVFLQTGCESLLEDIDVTLYDTLTSTPEERIEISPSKAWNPDFSSFHVNKVFAEVDVLINIAKLKSHSNALVTGAMKNMYGALETSEKRAQGHYCADPLWAKISRRNMARGYKLLSETFVQVHDAILKTFKMDEICIIDGVISGEGDGPLFQPALPRQENVIMASVNNPATIDAAESYYMGFSPDFLKSQAQYRLDQLNFSPDEDFLGSYADQYFLTLAESVGLGNIKNFKVYTMENQTTDIIPCEMLGLMRRGAVFQLPTFARFASNTPLYEQIPDGDFEFKIEATA